MDQRQVNKQKNGGLGNMSVSNKLLYLMVGGGIGAVTALLLAPKSGNELRGDIAQTARTGYDATVDKAKGLKEQSANLVQTVREKAGDVYSMAAGKLGGSSEGDDRPNPVPELASAAKGGENEAGSDKVAEQMSNVSNIH